jgi:PAS domain S-box-containing protein
MAVDELTVLQHLADTSVNGMAWTAVDGRIQYANPALLGLLGAEGASEALIGRALFTLYDDATCRELQEQIFPALLRQRSWSGQLSLPDSAGQPQPPALHTFTVLGDADGEQRVALVVSTALFSDAALDALPGLFYVLNQQGQMLRWNRQLQEITGYPHETMATMSALDFVVPEDVEKTRQAITEVFQGGVSSVESRLATHDGRAIYHYFTGIRSIFEGEVCVVGMAVDISARVRAEQAIKESEARYRTLFENAPEAIAVIDLDTGRFMDVNENAVKLYGLGREELLRGGPAQVSPATQPDGRSSEEAARHYVQLAFEGEVQSFEWTHLNLSTGQEVPCELWLVRLPSSQQRLVRGSIIDITERGRAEEERQRLEEQLQQSQKMEAIGRLAGGVAHDFNNILTGINGFTELILDGLAPDDPLRPDLEQIKQSGDRAADLTNQLLTFSRRQVIAPQVLDPNTIIMRSQQMLRRIIGETISLTFRPAGEPGRIRADPSQLDQILVNLVVNACEAMPRGGKLTIETQNVELDRYDNDEGEGELRRCVMLAVSDTGCGMDAATQEHIFEPFFTTSEQGTGLGLATVYGIVKQNGGEVRVYSEPEIGTTFRIYFPRVFEAAERISQEPAEGTLERGTETILLVEDEEMVRCLARRVLERRGYTVIEASDGAQALRAWEDHDGTIDLLLTDVVMPEMNGRVLYEQLLTRRPELKAIYMSGYTKDVIAHHQVLDRETDYLQKPFTIRALLHKVRTALQ